jgi:hypothetical protein
MPFSISTSGPEIRSGLRPSKIYAPLMIVAVDSSYALSARDRVLASAAAPLPAKSDLRDIDPFWVLKHVI